MSLSSTARPPLARGLPFVGSILALAHDAQDFFYAEYRRLGSVFRVRALNQEFKVLAGPEANIMLATEPDAFTAWDVWEPLVRDFGGEKTLTMLDGPEHARMRKLMHQTFARDTLLGQLDVVIALVLTNLHRYEPGVPIPAARFMQRITADVLGHLSNNRIPGEYFDDIVLWWNTLIEVYLSRMRPERVLKEPAYLHARSRVRAFAQVILSEPGSRDDDTEATQFLNRLAETSAADPEFLSHDEALFLSLAGYFAGLDTVANVASFMLYELLRHPAILEQARAEADQAFAAGAADPAAFRNMPTLHDVAMETLRLYPIAGALMRKTTREITLGGFTIPGGESLMIATAAPHFVPEIYKDPYTFDSTRFRAPRNEHRRRGVFAPFGSGPHTCLGAGLAEIQIMVTVATILHHAEIAMSPGNYRLQKAYTPSLTPKGFGFTVTRRRNESLDRVD